MMVKGNVNLFISNIKFIHPVHKPFETNPHMPGRAAVNGMFCVCAAPGRYLECGPHGETGFLILLNSNRLKLQ